MESRTPLGILTSSQQNSDTGDGLDFSKVTPSQFGISTDSLLTFSEDKSKSRDVRLKARRRSTIGVRGSPEMNSLICFRAKQAWKTPPRTSQNVLSSPLFLGCDSIKQKMAAFQRLMEADDEQTAPLVGPDESSGQDGVRRQLEGLHLDSQGCSMERERMRPPATPPLSKRRRRFPQGLCGQNIQEEPSCDLPGTPTQESGVSSSELQGAVATPDLRLSSRTGPFSSLVKPQNTRTDVPEVSSTSKKKRVHFGMPLSPEFFDKTLPPSTPLQRGATPACPTSSAGPKRSVLKTPQRCEQRLAQPVFSPTSDSPHRHADFTDLQKICFLMEEEFENTPGDRKDSTQAEDRVIPLAVAPTDPTQAEDSEIPLAVAPTDPAQAEDGDVIPLAVNSSLLNAAFQEVEDSLSHSPFHPPLPATEPEIHPEDQQQQQEEAGPERREEAGPERREEAGPERREEAGPEGSTTEALQSRSRKRKCPDEHDPPENRRSTRSASSAAKGKLKTAGVKRRFGSKEVDRSLYGKRDYASKDPLLSPIFEGTAATLIHTPTPLQPDCSPIPPVSVAHGPSDAEVCLLSAAALWRNRFLQTANESESGNKPTSEITSTSGLDTPASESEVSVTASGVSCADMTGSGTPRGKRGPARPPGRRRSRKTSAKPEKVAAPEGKNGKAEAGVRLESTGGEEVRGDDGDQAVSVETSSGPEVQQDEGCSLVWAAENTAELAEKLDQDKRRDPERKTPNRSKRVRVSRTQEKSSSVVLEEEDQRCVSGTEPSGDQNEPEEELGERSAAETRGEVRDACTDGSGDGGEDVEPVLESWQQADFSIEDVLKPMVRGRVSVRRSLRNRRSVDAKSSGLTWVERTPPEMSTASRRRTRGRLSAVLEPPPLLQAPREEEPNQAE